MEKSKLITYLIVMTIILLVQTPVVFAQYSMNMETSDDYYFGSLEVINEPESVITIIVNEDNSAKVSMILYLIPCSNLGVSGSIRVPIDFPSESIHIDFIGVGRRIPLSQRTANIQTDFVSVDYQKEIKDNSMDVIIDLPLRFKNDIVIKIEYTANYIQINNQFNFPLTTYTTITDILVRVVFEYSDALIEFDSFSISPPPSDDTYSLVRREIGRSSVYLIFEDISLTKFRFTFNTIKTAKNPRYIIHLSSLLSNLIIISLALASKPLKKQTSLFAFANKDFLRGPRKYIMAVIGVSIQSAVTSMSVFQSEVLKQEILAVLGSKYSPIIEPYTILLIIITIVIGSFLVINSIVSSLLERIREFGIMKAVGFNAAFIFKLTVLSSAIIGVMGGLLGCSLGVLFAFMPYLTFRKNLLIPYPIDLHSFYIVISIPVGLIAGYLFSKRRTVAIFCGSIAASLTYLIPLAFIFYASTVSITNILNKTLCYYLLLLALSISLSIISGILPAFWISKIKPVEAIRKTV